MKDFNPDPKQTRERLKRNSVAWKRRVKEVIERERYKCQVCNNSFPWNFLTVHHLKSCGAFGGDDAKNLISICRFCHNEVHNGNINLKEVKP